VIEAHELGELLATALARAGEPDAEAWATLADRGFARFSRGELSQHMQLSEPRAVVRVAKGRRVAEVIATTVDEAGVVTAVQDAARMALSIPEDESFPGFTDRNEPAPLELSRWVSSTAKMSAEDRAERLVPVLAAVSRAGLIATGVLDTSASVEAVATTRGLVRSSARTAALFKIWALESAGAGGASGHGFCADVDVERLALEAETRTAIEDALRAKNPGSLPAGDYDVVLAPLALAELVEWLAMIAFGAREVEQGVSPLTNRMGERITGPMLSVSDDPLGELSLSGPFDREGVAKERVALIEQGIARGVVHDRASAKRANARSTGSNHAPGAIGGGGPTPTAIVVSGGDAASLDELIGRVERGIYVRRLHYVNGLLEPRRAVMTGLTRDGTFLIEHGKLSGAVESMRITDSLLEAFERCDGLTRARQLVPNWWSVGGSTAVPGALLRRLRFTAGSRVR
jgi:predicted Zn-dependent protease